MNLLTRRFTCDHEWEDVLDPTRHYTDGYTWEPYFKKKCTKCGWSKRIEPGQTLGDILLFLVIMPIALLAAAILPIVLVVKAAYEELSSKKRV